MNRGGGPGDGNLRICNEIYPHNKLSEMEIDPLIIAETLFCRKNFECLNNSTIVYCTVENCINKKVHFIDSNDNLSCRYKLAFGYSYICNCPVRKEIYNKYNK
jgi:hypothetical protein